MHNPAVKKFTLTGQLLILAAVPFVLFAVLDFPLWMRISAIVVQFALLATGSGFLGAALKRSRYGQDS